MIKRTTYWHNYTIIIALIKNCWQELSRPLILTQIQELIPLKLAALLVHMDPASPSFFFDQMYITQVVTAWFRYECQNQDPHRHIVHDPQALVLNEQLVLAVDRIEYLPDGTTRYLFYTFAAASLKFIGHLQELRSYQIALVQLHYQSCRIVPVKRQQPDMSLENVTLHPVNPRRCLACYRKYVMR